MSKTLKCFVEQWRPLKLFISDSSLQNQALFDFERCALLQRRTDKVISSTFIMANQMNFVITKTKPSRRKQRNKNLQQPLVAMFQKSLKVLALHVYVSQTQTHPPLCMSTRRNGKIFSENFLSHLSLEFQQTYYTLREKSKKTK